MSTPAFSRAALAGLVSRTIDALKNAKLPLDMPGTRELVESRSQLLTQLESRILPHLHSDDLPAVIVFGGSSGAGKSTLVNSLVREEVSPASVLRPTTRTPVMLIHPRDYYKMGRHALSRMGKYEVVTTAIEGIVIVDAPDLDSVDDSNRALSSRLIDAADLWVFVTTASRYGDAVAWDTLQMANMRGVTCAVVLDRVPAAAMPVVRRDLAHRMEQMGLAESPLFIVPDAGAHSGLLPDELVKDLREWLEVVARTKAGDSLVDRTTAATLPQLRQDLLFLADAVEAQDNALTDLKDKAFEGAQEPMEKLATNISHGRFGQGAPTTSWLSLASTGGPLAGMVAGRRPNILDRRSGARDRAMTTIFDSVLTSVRVALTQGLTAARVNVNQAWEFDVVNTAELRAQANANVDIDAIVDRALDGWKSDLLKLRMGDNPWLGAAGVASLLGVGAGGIAGAQKVAEALGGKEAVGQAREDLTERVRQALRELVAAYTSVVNAIDVGDAATLRLRASEFLNR
ncbi:GTPase domain-containing protein [Trueperella pecoris]|uniref:GTPase domain-containing protein n=1 Tax=Trueperella pecoris TaxID=2733571 RepID=A0A7M1R4A6_9ACTO|nr:GTPase domain-containing protein [Trueperella pecoris]QOR48305.1 GTPase domain-containing protein [Trueperella pecoris]